MPNNPLYQFLKKKHPQWLLSQTNPNYLLRTLEKAGFQQDTFKISEHHWRVDASYQASDALFQPLHYTVNAQLGNKTAKARAYFNQYLGLVKITMELSSDPAWTHLDKQQLQAQLELWIECAKDKLDEDWCAWKNRCQKLA